MKLKVAIFEDNKLIRDAMQAILDGTAGYSCCGTYPDGNSWERNIRSCEPDVVLMDIEMPGLSGIEVTREIHKAFPEIKILIQTVFNDSDKIFNALSAGASGYILKNDSPARQLDAIQEVFNGGAPMSPSIAKKVLEFFANENVILVSPEAVDYRLSEREREILALMTKGHNFHTIAEKCFISYETVRTHVKRIYKKLHVASKSEAITKASQQRII